MKFKRMMYIVMLSLLTVLPNLILAIFIPLKDVTRHLFYTTIYGLLLMIIFSFLYMYESAGLKEMQRTRYRTHGAYHRCVFLRILRENLIYCVSYAIFSALFLWLRGAEGWAKELIYYVIAQYILMNLLYYGYHLVQSVAKKSNASFFVALIYSIAIFLAFVSINPESFNVFTNYSNAFADYRHPVESYFLSTWSILHWLKAVLAWFIAFTLYYVLRRRMKRD